MPGFGSFGAGGIEIVKRGTPKHPKVYDLCEILKTGRPAVIGYLELLWHFTAEFAPQGDVGRYSDKRIEAAVDWKGRPGHLISALVQTKWLDRDLKCRLLVHGWQEHADDSVRKRLTRHGLQFVELTPEPTGQSTVTDRTLSARVPDKICLPLPEPLPKPEPNIEACSTVPVEPPPAPELSIDSPPFETTEPDALFPQEEQEKATTDAWLDKQHDSQWWPVYWRHVAKADSRKAFRSRVRSLMRERKITPTEAVQFLCAEARDDRKRFEPTEDWSWRSRLLPATWLRGERWGDDAQQPTATPTPQRMTLMDRRTSATERALKLAQEMEQC